MEIIILLLIAAVAITIVFFAVCVVVSAINYAREEINHAIKSMKRSARDFLWELEWKWGRR